MNKLSTKDCEYYKSQSKLVASSKLFAGGFPREVFVESHYTGRVVRFVPLTPDHKNFDQDQWDGEEMHYSPAPGEFQTNCKELVILHAW